MNEIIAALIGALAGFVGTMYGIHRQFKREEEKREKDDRNDIVSMVDIMIFKIAKVRNNSLSFESAILNKEGTSEIYKEIEDDYITFDKQLQELIVMMSHHEDDPNKHIQKLLEYYQPVEVQFNKFKTSYRIYKQKYKKSDCHERSAIAYSKLKVEEETERFINNVKHFCKAQYGHDMYTPKLTEMLSKDAAKETIKSYQINS